jgi:hypothetical protein
MFAIENGIADADAEQMAEFWNGWVEGDLMAYAEVRLQVVYPTAGGMNYAAMVVTNEIGAVTATNYYATVTLTNGTTSTFTVKNGSKGSTGATGADGKTPVKGTDYWTITDQAAIVQQVIDRLQTPVFGTVDENNVITLTGALQDGTYTIKYEGKDGTVTEIGTLIHSSVPEPTYTNLFDPTTATLNQRMSGTSSAPKAANGYLITALISIPETAVTKTSNDAFVAVPASMWSASANMFLAQKNGTTVAGYCSASTTKGETTGDWVKIPLLTEWGDGFTCNGVTISLYVKGSAITVSDIQNIGIYFNELPE